MTVSGVLINWEDFKKVELRKGTILKAEKFPEVRRPAYKVWVDFGPDIGIRKTSAQITDYYKPEELTGKPVIGVTNFPRKQIGPFMSEFLLVGFEGDSQLTSGAIILATCDPMVPDGALLK